MLTSVLRRGAVSLGLGRRAFHTARPILATAADSDTSSGFKWQHLVTPYTSAEFSEEMRGVEATLQAMKQELSGVPDRVDPINWAEWEEKIDDKAMVDTIKQSYDSFKTEEAKGTTDVQQLNNEIDQAVSHRSTTPHHTPHPRAGPSPDPPPPTPPPPPHSPPLPPSLCCAQIAAAGDSESVIAEWVSTYKAELTAAQKEKRDIHGWHFHDYLRRYPGLAEQMRAEYMEGYQLPPESLERLTESDLSELKRQVKNGGRLSSDEEIPTRVGDYDYEEELKKTEELARKLFGPPGDDNPQLKDIQAQIQREQLAVKQLQQAQAHDEEEHH